MTESATAQSLCNSWRNLDPAILQDTNNLTHPFLTAKGDNVARKLYYSNCESMTFQNNKGTILVVNNKGDKMVSDNNQGISLPLSGELSLPPLVSASIRGGRSRVIF